MLLKDTRVDATAQYNYALHYATRNGSILLLSPDQLRKCRTSESSKGTPATHVS